MLFVVDKDLEELSPVITAPYPHIELCSAQEDQPLLPETEIPIQAIISKEMPRLRQLT